MVKCQSLFSLFFPLFFFYNTLCISRQKGAMDQSTRTLLENQLQFSSSIVCTDDGIDYFLKHTYNNPHYALFLGNDFSHMIKLLHYGEKTQQPRSFMYTILRLFNNKLKQSPYVNADAFLLLCSYMPHMLIGCMRQTFCFEQQLVNHMQDLFYERFLEQFDQFQQYPEQFLQMLSRESVSLCLNKHLLFGTVEDTMSKETVQKALLLFFQTAISRLMWNKEDREETWNVFHAIAEKLELFVDCALINNIDDINDLFISLVERYCFFLDIASEFFDESTLLSIKKTIQGSYLLLFELDEQEEYIETKYERLMRAIDDIIARYQLYREYNVVVCEEEK